ncbi:TPA: Panacea domain-containing protein [Vibrio parahaemolyticus]|uniref:Panacea domain-containing protein n=1 Tax=Vibrio parahaemolyticus TaxID=670 RepID=UPI00226993BB|nr:type II toxin-antitoxin system antitoxin SocA domain-containing protein [Vibrio parahaemolyticus]MCX8905722.1 DUF4065 domain-containing protein [Vibrio parahaemolyticus]
MSHSAIDVAYRLLQIAKENGKELSNLQLQKLVYIAHGYLLGWMGLPLIRDSVQAWRYGPVLHEIYKQFKDNGRNKVPTDGIEKITFQEAFSEAEEECLRGVLKLYGDDAPESLINITHQKNTPWDEVWNNRGGKNELFAVIPDELIKNHYRKVVSDPDSVDGL